MINAGIDVRYSKIMNVEGRSTLIRIFSEIRTNFDMKISILHKVHLEQNDPCAE